MRLGEGVIASEHSVSLKAWLCSIKSRVVGPCRSCMSSKEEHMRTDVANSIVSARCVVIVSQGNIVKKIWKWGGKGGGWLLQQILSEWTTCADIGVASNRVLAQLKPVRMVALLRLSPSRSSTDGVRPHSIRDSALPALSLSGPCLQLPSPHPSGTARCRCHFRPHPLQSQ